MSGTAKTVLIVGGLGILALLLFEKTSSGVITTGTTTLPVNSTAGQVVAGVGAFSSIAASVENLFSGPTTAPLTSGASPSNPNDVSDAALNSLTAANAQGNVTDSTIDSVLGID